MRRDRQQTMTGTKISGKRMKDGGEQEQAKRVTGTVPLREGWGGQRWLRRTEHSSKVRRKGLARKSKVLQGNREGPVPPERNLGDRDEAGQTGS